MNHLSRRLIILNCTKHAPKIYLCLLKIPACIILKIESIPHGTPMRPPRFRTVVLDQKCNLNGSSVNIELALLDLAHKDLFDHAFLLSRDSDLAPAVHKLKQNFPKKKITILAPYNYRQSSELMQAADADKIINLTHLSTSLFQNTFTTPAAISSFVDL